MRAGLSTIQQTLTPEAASVLSHSIAEAGRRNHGQTTPLHVAATLLSSPTGYLRQACIRSHPNSSHPLQCRALELCFSVALERLPAATSSPAVTEPPISNALMAALKRAQAHQRRGCPEQQQQPLLAVKVELEQLIMSILDDPSVSRVMREASFSSPAVKAAIEQSLNNNIAGGNNIKLQFRPSPSPATTPVHIPINRNLYLNPRFQQMNDETTVSSSAPANLYLNPRLQRPGNLSLNQSGHQRYDDVKRVIDIMSKSKKKNPILVGEMEPEAIRKEILRRIEKSEFETAGELKNSEVILIEKQFASLSDKSLIPNKIKELGDVIESKIGSSESKGIIIDLADLKWLVEQPPTTTVVSDTGRESVAEMAKLVAKFAGKVWLIGTATCETYLRCQIYHPSMEYDWDLQALPIASRSPVPGMFPRMGTSIQKAPFCLKCSSSYEQELAKLNISDEVKSTLPQWLRNAKAENGEIKTTDQSCIQVKDQELILRQRTQELQKKWSDRCSLLHHNDSRIATMVVPLAGMYKPNKLLGQSQTIQEPYLEPPRSPVRTELALGPKKARETVKVNEDLTAKDLLGCISSEPKTAVEEFQKGKIVNSADVDSFKKLLKGLMKHAWWQPEAASTIATAVTQSKLTGGSRGSLWLLFAGPDRVGKTKMASVLAEHVCGADPITICLGSEHVEKLESGFRGKTVLDRIVELVRKNPFSVIVLSDVDQADTLVRGSIKRAMERGRLTDSYGREISLGNVIFVLTGNWSTVNPDEHRLEEKRLQSVATDGWLLRLTVGEKRPKRRASWPMNNTKQQKKLGFGLSLDLNLTADVEEDRTDGSDLTEQEDVFSLENHEFRVTVPGELVGPSDGTVVFKPVEFSVIHREIEKTVKSAFLTTVDEKVSIEVDEATVENMLRGLWFGRTGLEKWVERVLIPSFHEVKAHISSPAEGVVVRIESDRCSVEVSGGSGGGDWLPTQITVVVDKV